MKIKLLEAKRIEKNEKSYLACLFDMNSNHLQIDIEIILFGEAKTLSLSEWEHLFDGDRMALSETRELLGKALSGESWDKEKVIHVLSSYAS